MSKLNQIVLTLMLGSCFLLSGCVGKMIGTATDVAVETAKVPFKVGGAVADVVKGDEEDDKE